MSSKINEAVERGPSDARWDDRLEERDIFGIHGDRYDSQKYDNPVQQAYDRAYGTERAGRSNSANLRPVI